MLNLNFMCDIRVVQGDAWELEKLKESMGVKNIKYARA